MEIQFSRAGQRRFNSRVRGLLSLLEQNEKLFLREWHRQVQGWLGEIHYRASNWRNGTELRSAEDPDGVFEQGRTQIFGILNVADSLLVACGSEAERIVGDETRCLLINECIKAVASVCDGRLNHMVDHRIYHRAKS